MMPIVTVTLNPAIDGAAEVEQVRSIRKMRAWGERYDPGGGGINVARVVKELGGSVFAIYLSGGITGQMLDGLMHTAGIEGKRIPITGNTRISYTVHERSTGSEFRFVPEGPLVAPLEWEACLAAVEDSECDYLVASGSLPRGVPNNFYVQVAQIAVRKGAKFVLDTSGAALRSAIQNGVYLFKPSLGELEELVGRKLSDREDQEVAVCELVKAGAAEIVTLTLGRDGALMAHPDGIPRLEGVKVVTHSAVGAGDSFVAAMILGLAQGRTREDAFALGVAAGSAAVMTPGTELCRRSDVERIHAQIQQTSRV